MAYAHYNGDSTSGPTSGSYGKPTTLMVTDIADLQYMYEVNNQYNITDTNYTLSSFSDYNYIYAAIWDSVGEDTFSWSNQSTIANIDLDAGAYSFFGDISSQLDTDLKGAFSSGDGLLGIAYDCVIENAKGGTASDTIAGNSSANKIYGGTVTSVKDTMTGNGGADIFVRQIGDANTNLDVADIITDFTDGTDKIGLKDVGTSDFSGVLFQVERIMVILK